MNTRRSFLAAAVPVGVVTAVQFNVDGATVRKDLSPGFFDVAGKSPKNAVRDRHVVSEEKKLEIIEELKGFFVSSFHLKVNSLNASGFKLDGVFRDLDMHRRRRNGWYAWGTTADGDDLGTAFDVPMRLLRLNALEELGVAAILEHAISKSFCEQEGAVWRSKYFKYQAPEDHRAAVDAMIAREGLE